MISLTDVEAARTRIDGCLHRTPLKRSKALSDRLGTNVFVKMECFQKTGSFKPRGAFNVMLSLDEEARARGVVGFSGGNFAQGMAFAGQQLSVDTLVIMAEATPRNYVDGTKSYGATVELTADIAEAIAASEAYADAGRTLMHPFDTPEMMAGNGTVGLEIVEDVPDLTHLFVSIGGGGLLTGAATAVLGMRPDTQIIGVETEGADVVHQCLEAGESVTITPNSIAKTLGSPTAAADVLELAKTSLAGLARVSDAAAFEALRLIAERLKVVVEPAASCTLTAAEQRKDEFGPDDNVVLLFCGGNVSLADIAQWHTRFGDRC